jgi:tetratricopeptide (TPR) repeat protein
MSEQEESRRKAISLNSRGIHLIDKDRHEEAITAFDEALSLDPGLTGVLFNRAEAYHRKGENEKARSDLVKALTAAPKEADYLHAMGLLAYEDDDFDTAMEWYDKALAEKPDLQEAWNDKGVIEFRRGNYNRAKTFFERAVSIEPNSYDSWYNLADTYEELGMRSERSKALAALKRIGNEPDEDRENTD